MLSRRCNSESSAITRALRASSTASSVRPTVDQQLAARQRTLNNPGFSSALRGSSRQLLVARSAKANA